MQHVHQRSVVSMPTGISVSGHSVSELLKELLAATVARTSDTTIIDLAEGVYSASALRELVVPLGQEIKGGVHGERKFIIATSNAAVREFIQLLAESYSFSAFLAVSTAPLDLQMAEPVGGLTETDHATLNAVQTLGFHTTAASLSTSLDLKPTAASNRLKNLEAKGLVYRLAQEGRSGDIFVDPRAPQQHIIVRREHHGWIDPDDSEKPLESLFSSPFDHLLAEGAPG